MAMENDLFIHCPIKITILGDLPIGMFDDLRVLGCSFGQSLWLLGRLVLAWDTGEF